MTRLGGTNVETFFRNYAEVMARYKFSPDRIVNTDETSVSTVMQAPKVISEKGKKQVGQCVSSERETLVTVCGIITATSISIPPVFPECGWMSAEVFVKLLEHIHKHMQSTRDNHILLLLDNHETHVSLEAINYCTHRM